MHGMKRYQQRFECSEFATCLNRLLYARLHAGVQRGRRGSKGMMVHELNLVNVTLSTR